MTTPPTIETERTVLRAHRLEDLDDYAALWADPVVTRFIGGVARTREESWIRMLRYAGMWQLVGYGLWIVEEKATGRLVGEAGFHEMKRDILPSFEGTPEAGWAFLPAVHGRGIATEVVRRIHEWAQDRPGFASTVCIIDPDNAASLAVAHKAGYRERQRTAYHGVPTILMQR
ncbi:GNAT family N-acetyltransferase [Mesorhizobium marinum]|uniref:GNAT family N-acetyltransferase n=1 Tax=Mesorhizobium marinum TaxID=3228790 RepID=UPI003467917D